MQARPTLLSTFPSYRNDENVTNTPEQAADVGTTRPTLHPILWDWWRYVTNSPEQAADVGTTHPTFHPIL